ncbi:MAG: tagaturonate reductase [Bacteroidetes bacterium]|nr:tagaturonate reductase [Bacteroidota bacterium]
MTTLSKQILPQLDSGQISVPAADVFGLPEKVLQFGTGVLLRGLPDHFIDVANKKGVFNGRILVVKSTNTGGTDGFARQDGMYTLLERGVIDGEVQEQVFVNASISRVLSAADDWDQILMAAANPSLQLIISNTTEVGIVLEESDIYTAVPVSFPGRLLAFLEERFRVFDGAAEAGMVIVPTELIVDNGIRLRDIVTRLAIMKGLPEAFMNWLANDNNFCNSLVDCIVPGKLPIAEQAAIEQELGYHDELMIMSEPYRLWAIETTQPAIRSLLSFAACHEGVVIAADINKFRELKLRLLNATHTLTCGLAHLWGFATVKAAMQDTVFESFINQLVFEEIVPLVISEDISKEEAVAFGKQVLDRFRNPHIEHLWLSITAQYTSKMQMRVVPLLQKQYSQKREIPQCIAAGFAGFLLFMRAEEVKNPVYQGKANGQVYRINDDKAALLATQWQKPDLLQLVQNSFHNVDIFGADLTIYPGFAEAVCEALGLLLAQGPEKTVRSILAKKSLA